MAASDGPGPETWEYDVLAVAETGGVSLRHIAFDIFAREGLVEQFGIPEERFKALLERLEQSGRRCTGDADMEVLETLAQPNERRVALDLPDETVDAFHS